MFSWSFEPFLCSFHFKFHCRRQLFALLVTFLVFIRISFLKGFVLLADVLIFISLSSIHSRLCSIHSLSIHKCLMIDFSLLAWCFEFRSAEKPFKIIMRGLLLYHRIFHANQQHHHHRHHPPESMQSRCKNNTTAKNKKCTFGATRKTHRNTPYINFYYSISTVNDTFY